MALTIPEILFELQQADQKAQVAMFVDRRIVSVQEVVKEQGTPYVFLCEKPRSFLKDQFTESEKGLIGYCSANGIDDKTIARLLGRKPEGITRMRKKLGF